MTNKTDSKGSESALQLFGRDLTQAARNGELNLAFGRDVEIRRVTETLIRRTKNNPVLVGEPGVGKTAIVEGLAMKIVNREVTENLVGTSLICLDINALIAGTKERGAFEERLREVVEELVAKRGSIILFIDEIHMLVGAGSGGSGNLDAANLLKPALSRGELRLIGATTFYEYQKYIEKDAALERRFEPVHVSEPDEKTTVSILRGLKSKWQNHYGVRLADDALIAAVKLSRRYIASRFFPDKAIDLVETACAKVAMQVDGFSKAIDVLKHEQSQLELELDSLSDDSDSSPEPASKRVERVRNIQLRLDALLIQSQAVRVKWNAAKEATQAIRQTRQQIKTVDVLIEHAERDGHVARLVELEKTLAFHYQNLKAQQQRLERACGRVDVDVVTKNTIAEVVSEKIGISLSKVSQSEGSKLMTIEKEIEKRVVGQSEAVSAVARSLRRARAGLSDTNRPIGSFLFVGPTGTGKTELAKALSEFLFDDENAMVRIDMSEYFDRYSIARLIGAPPGYVGFDEGGQLTEAVRRKPYCCILLDEIEKAHRDVHNILLQILDDGRLTDGKGRVVDFRNSLIIMTSNVSQSELRTVFRPEFLNRVDDIVAFHALTKTDLLRILDVQICRLNRKLQSHDLGVSISDDAKEFIVSRSYDASNGVRPMKRFLKTHVEDQIAAGIICGAFSHGSSTDPRNVFKIKVELNGDGTGLQIQSSATKTKAQVPRLETAKSEADSQAEPPVVPPVSPLV